MEQVAEINLDDQNDTKRFNTYLSFFDWLQGEQQSWAWLADHNHGSIYNHISGAFENIRQSVTNYQVSSQPLESISAIVSPHYQTSGYLRHSEGSFSKKIDRIRDTKGDSAAAFAFAFAKQLVSVANISDPLHLAACILFSLPELDEPNSIAERLEKERNNYRARISSHLEKIDTAADKRDQSYKNHLHVARRLAIRQLLQTRSIDRQFRTSLGEKVTNSVTSIRGVEETFRIKMGLQAPVKYWEDKAAKHRTSSADAATRPKWFFPFAALTFVVAFGGAAELLLNNDSVHQTVYIIVAAGLGSLAALIFWIGRLFTKLYLSQHHLLHDAEERAVMTTTYLSLSHENAASEEDKKIILGALFRPTADGLIKEDGPSELSLAGLLSKLGTSK